MQPHDKQTQLIDDTFWNPAPSLGGDKIRDYSKAAATPDAEILLCGRGMNAAEFETVESNESGYTTR